jgi:hypothetical protein
MFDVIIDTREKQPWSFAQSSSIDNIINKKLDTGDYSIVGLEDVLCIERKRSVSELATNITQDRFKNEMERMSNFPYKFLILEFDYFQIDMYPEGSNIPKDLQSKIRINGSYIMKVLSEIQVRNGIHVIACGNVAFAEHVAINLMKRVYELRKT